MVGEGVGQFPPSLPSSPHKGQGPDTWAGGERRRLHQGGGANGRGRGLICMDGARPPIRTGGATARAPFGGGLTAPGPYGRRVLRPAGVGRRRALPGGFGPVRGRCQSRAAASGARLACRAG